MFRKINSWFLKPYPAITSIKEKIILSLVFGKIVFLFLYLFRPFDMGKLDNNMLHFSLGFGLITFLVCLINIIIGPLIFPKFFDTNKWTIGKVVLFFLVTILLVSIANWYYNLQVARPAGLLEDGLLHIVMVTLLVGFFPLLFFIFIRERKINKQHVLVAQKLSKTKQDKSVMKTKETTTDIQTTLKDENQKDSIALDIKDLLYISSEANYASVFYIYKGKIKECLLRNSLNNIEKQLSDYQQIVRCHKSYIINAHQVVKMQGNARGYFLELPNIDFPIPVSRSFPSEFLYTLIK